jgi:hypothetical protein
MDVIDIAIVLHMRDPSRAFEVLVELPCSVLILLPLPLVSQLQ